VAAPFVPIGQEGVYAPQLVWMWWEKEKSLILVVIKSQCQAVLTEDLVKRHVSAKFIPQMLTKKQTQNSLSMKMAVF
jgi:hypothetical protein